MCFSATASFTAGMILMGIGILCANTVRTQAKPSVSQAQKRSLYIGASIPFLFGAHQLVESWVWLDPTNIVAVRLFAYTAYTFWPIFISVAVYYAEVNRPANLPVESSVYFSWPHTFLSKQRRLTVLQWNVGLALLLTKVVTGCLYDYEPLFVVTLHDRLQYESCLLHMPRALSNVGRFLYTYAVVGSLFMCSWQYSFLMAGLTCASAALSIYLWEEQFESTWCYFAAVISGTVLFVLTKELQCHPDKPSKNSA